MLEVKNLSFRYRRRGRMILDGLNLTIEPGNVYGLLGSNGVGKSTLLYLICGVLMPNEGDVELEGVKTYRRLPATLSEIFIVPEEIELPRIILSDFVRANSVFYPNFSMDDMRRYLNSFGMEEDIHLGELSMGQKKKVFISFALACHTKLLLMDEPTNGLDIPGKSSFRRIVAGEMTDDRSIVISTHQVRDIDRLLDHVILMDNTHVLMNESVMNITNKLKFEVSDNREDIANALYAQPAIEGTFIVSRNTNGAETEINLESLFELAMAKPELINQMFNVEK